MVMLGEAIAAAVQAANDAVTPAEGVVVHSLKLGSDPRYYYTLQVRLFPCGTYGLVSRHSSGHQRPEKQRYECLEDAVTASIRQKREYQECEAEERAYAAEAYFESLREED